MQLCVHRGADAFLVKPLGCEAVQHIWQFVRGLRPNADASLPPSGTGLATAGAASTSAETARVPGEFGGRPDPASDVRSVYVCNGTAALTASASGPSIAVTTVGEARAASGARTGNAAAGNTSRSRGVTPHQSPSLPPPLGSVPSDNPASSVAMVELPPQFLRDELRVGERVPQNDRSSHEAGDDPREEPEELSACKQQ